MMLIENAEDLKKLKTKDSFKFICKRCGKVIEIKSFRTSRINAYSNFLCNMCNLKVNYLDNAEKVKKALEKARKTKKELYGDPNYNNHEKAKETLKFKTGKEYPMQVYEYKRNFEKSMINKYGVKYSGSSKELLDKTRKTKKELYGDENYTNIEKIAYSLKNRTDEQKRISIFKARKTKKELYGDPNYTNKEKAKNTLIERYGVDAPFKNKKIFLKAMQTYKIKTGYDHPLNNPDNRFNKYEYFGTNFDSGWELALWIYAKDHNEEIIREPVKLGFIYDGKTHNYYPDFKYKGKLIEIKGNHYFLDYDTSKRMIFPYSRLHSNSKLLTPEEKEYMDDLYEAKHQCGLKNGVEFWGKKEMEPYMEYIDSKYGSSYLAQFKIKK